MCLSAISAPCTGTQEHRTIVCNTTLSPEGSSETLGYLPVLPLPWCYLVIRSLNLPCFAQVLRAASPLPFAPQCSARFNGSSLSRLPKAQLPGPPSLLPPAGIEPSYRAVDTSLSMLVYPRLDSHRAKCPHAIRPVLGDTRTRVQLPPSSFVTGTDSFSYSWISICGPE